LATGNRYNLDMRKAESPLIRRFVPLLAAFVCLTPIACGGRQDVVTRTIADGVTYTQEIRQADGSLIVNVLRIDLKRPGVTVRCGLANDKMNPTGPSHGLEHVASIVGRSGAVAGTNADYFPYTCDPVGLAIRNGEILSEPLDYRACLGIRPGGQVVMDVLAIAGEIALPDGSTLPVDGVNRTARADEIVVYTPSFVSTPSVERAALCIPLTGATLPLRVSQETSGVASPSVALKPNDRLPACPPNGLLLVATGSEMDRLAKLAPNASAKLRIDLAGNSFDAVRGRFPSRADYRGRTLPHVWTDVEQAVGGGPWLVRDGRIAVDSGAESFDASSFVLSRHARTAVGIDAAGQMLLVTVDRRAEASRGASLDEMARIMKDLGAVNAMNLDGGGSTTMSIYGGVVNAPSDGRARPVADMLLVFANPLPDAAGAGSLHIVAGSTPPISLAAGDSLTLSVAGEGDKATELPVVWSTVEGTGFVSQRGVFRSTVTGDTTIRASVGAHLLTLEARVVPGAPARLRAALTQAPNNPPDRNVLVVNLQDRFGNGIPARKLTAHVTGGELQSELETGANGKAVAEIVWDAPPGQRSVSVESEAGLSASLRG
jgi:hypothetical protein